MWVFLAPSCVVSSMWAMMSMRLLWVMVGFLFSTVTNVDSVHWKWLCFLSDNGVCYVLFLFLRFADVFLVVFGVC